LGTLTAELQSAELQSAELQSAERLRAAAFGGAEAGLINR
jgi:hypothetical protein